jgi:beta-glucanase (GH16 family)
MRYIKLSLFLLMTAMVSCDDKEEWKLTWADEFDVNGLPDSAKWSFETKGNVYGWGNNELQFYTEKEAGNAFVENGILKIVAKQDSIEGKGYTSARLITHNKASFTYGRMEIRAKLPAGRGLWPAIWMLGDNIHEKGWPLSGEIDIMEHVGYEKDSIYGTIHSDSYNHIKKTEKTKAIFLADPYTDFHIYGIEWTPEKIEFFVDEQVYNTVINEHLSEKEWPFDQPFYFILNLAVGGNWGGKMGVDETVFPATMEVDYVRVYQKENSK